MNSSNAAWLLIAAFFLFFNGCKRTTGHSGIFANSSVLLVTIDTVRADHLGCYGYKTASTPTIDGLAASGGRFARAYAHNVVTLPSHANILSGLYPIQHGIRDNTGFRFPKNADTVATLLKARGFACGAFIGAFPVDSRFGLDRGFDVYDESYGDTTRAQDFRFVERRAEEVITPFLNWLDQQKKGTRWFAWVHLYDAHSPYDPPEPYRTQFAGRLYEGEIAYVDAQIGRALDHLRETGWLGSTYVIITADHGEGLGDHNEPTHGIFAYEATLHIPLVIAGPGIAPGVVRSTVRHIDILPTILDLTGSVIPGILNGKSLQPLLFGHSDPAGGRDLYFEAISASLNRDWAPLTGVIAGAYKYIDLPLPELYNIEKDPAEAVNLINQDPENVAQCRKQLSSMLATGRKIQRIAEDPSTIERLKSLGYVSGKTQPNGLQRVYSSADDPKNLINFDSQLDDGIAAASSGDMERARVIFSKILEKRPTMNIASGHLAFVYRQMGKPEKGIEAIERCIKAGGESADLLTRLGLCLDDAGQSARAIEILQKAAKQTEDNADALTYLGMAYDHLGQADRAIATFEQILASDPRDAAAYANLGAVYLGRKEYNRAIQVLDKALQIDPKFASAHNSMGVAMASTGNMDAAISSWRLAVQYDPTQYDTIYNLAILFLRQGRDQDARPYMELFVRTAPPARYGADIEEFRRML